MARLTKAGNDGSYKLSWISEVANSFNSALCYIIVGRFPPLTRSFTSKFTERNMLR